MTYFQEIEQESPCRKEYPDQSTVLAWMHCHFNGVKCHLSSIDLHKQFIWEKHYPHILSIVVEIGPKGKKKYDFCQLSEKGTQKVIACNQEECKQDQNVNRLSVPHKACSYPRFTEFVKNQIIFANFHEVSAPWLFSPPPPPVYLQRKKPFLPMRFLFKNIRHSMRKDSPL